MNVRLPRIERYEPVPVAVRAVALAAGAVLALVPATTPVGRLVVLACACITVAVPRTLGSIPPTAAFVVVWVVSPGWDGAPSLSRTAAAAAALYVLHSATALAAILPLDTAVGPVVVRAWAVRAVGPAAAAALVGALSAVLPEQGGSALPELLGLVGVVLVGAAIAWAALRRDYADPRPTGPG